MIQCSMCAEAELLEAEAYRDWTFGDEREALLFEASVCEDLCSCPPDEPQVPERDSG